ncbi:MAG TPA: hypothetical protein VNW30_08155 [Opitutaceae bacterium]|jgi:hypothetical protein|nr:hypothetical protein [Opitutaceae bacterium]
MKIASIITLVIAILGLTLACWNAQIAFSDGQRIYEGYTKADNGVTGSDWSMTAQGLDTIHWALKDIRISQDILALGLAIAVTFSVVSFVLLILVSRKKWSQSPEPTHEHIAAAD